MILGLPTEITGAKDTVCLTKDHLFLMLSYQKVYNTDIDG